MKPFTKMHGIGNDFVLINRFAVELTEAELPELARRMCDRRFGIGSDGLLLAEPGTQAKFRMRMLNPDGSESEMCGNGVRCFARYLQEQGLTTETRIPVETGAGVLVLETKPGGLVQVDMGPARLTRGEVGMVGDTGQQFINEPVDAADETFMGTAVSMGNPHLVVLVPDADAVDLTRLGPLLEHNELFPARVNVHFIQVLDRGHLKQRTWERGAGVTLACGTGACASAVAAFLNGVSDRQVEIHLPGGNLNIDYHEDGRVFMTGPAEKVFEGVWPD